mmetsp:Transcript_21541/g.46846  ORF Transcript_21541/g.46846 Transcript_21541/m.46846 type:complete len:535 (+) Transcript_21541:778-2382(+)
MTLREDNLWCEIFGRAAQSVRLIHDNLRKTQIDKDGISKRINKDVLRFQITVGNVSMVKVRQRLEDASCVEARVGVGDTITRLGMNYREELSALHQLDEHVQVSIILERANEVNDEGMFDGRHDVLFANDSLHLMMPDNFPFIQHLERVRRARLLVTNEPNFSKRTHTQNTESREILKVDGTVEFGCNGGHGLSKSGNVSNDALDGALRQYSTGRLLLGSNRLLTDGPILRLNQLVPKVIPRTQVANHSIFVGDRNFTLPNNVKILLGRLSLLREDFPLVKRDLGDQIRQSRHLVRLEQRIGENGNTHQNALFHRMIDQILQRTQRLLERFPRQTKRNAGGLRGNVRQTGIPREQGAFSKEIPRPQHLIDVLRIPKSNVVNLDATLLQNVEYLPHIALVDNAIPLLKTNSRERIGNLDQHPLIQIRQKLHLPEHIQHILLLTRIVIRKHVTKRPLIDLPQLTVRIGNTRGRTGTIVQERQFPEGCTAGTGPHVIAIHGEGYVTIFHDVEVIPHFSLLDDDRAGGDCLGLHGIDE